MSIFSLLLVAAFFGLPITAIILFVVFFVQYRRLHDVEPQPSAAEFKSAKTRALVAGIIAGVLVAIVIAVVAILFIGIAFM